MSMYNLTRWRSRATPGGRSAWVRELETPTGRYSAVIIPDGRDKFMMQLRAAPYGEKPSTRSWWGSFERLKSKARDWLQEQEQRVRRERRRTGRRVSP